MTADGQILVLTTGGTIDKLYFDALSDFQIGGSMAQRIFEIGRVTHPFRIEEAMRKDSLDLDAGDRAEIAKTVARAAETRILITHGTDTMTETAAALAPIRGKTIVLVGALAPARFTESDASFNLGMAFATAQIAPRGIYVTMNGTVFPASSVVKDREKGAFVPRGRVGAGV
jgi:L-asparaginase